MMKCSKCGHHNITKANYCQKCGASFQEAERKKAYQKTIFYQLEQLEKWYKRLTLQTITGSTAFHVIVLILVLGFGIYQLVTMGNDLKILNSKQYEVFYYQQEKEYYLLVADDLEEVSLNLYVPNRVKNMEIIHYAGDGEEIDRSQYNKAKDFVLKTNQEDYYLLVPQYQREEKQTIKLTIYHRNSVDLDQQMSK